MRWQAEDRRFDYSCCALAFFLLLPLSVAVEAMVIKGGVGVGEQSTGELFPEEDEDDDFTYEEDTTHSGMFYGLGSDGTVSANKNSIKIIGDATENYAQGYFVYDSKKAGAMTISHLRFGTNPIKSTYLIQKTNFVACHQFNFLEKFDVLGNANKGGTFLLNSHFTKDEVWDKIPTYVQQQIIDKDLKFYVINSFDLCNNELTCEISPK